jgi:hypothetical protein
MVDSVREGAMDDTTVQVTYFSAPGPQNTAATLAAALKRARELGITRVVVASDTGATARQTLETFGADFQVTVVTNAPGLSLPIGKLHDYLPPFRALKQKLERAGVKAVPVSLTEAQVAELREKGATVLRIDWKRLAAFARIDLRAIERIGVAVRVALCCAVTAYLEGALPAGEQALALAGTGFGGGGADTAIVVRPAAAWRDWRVLETIVRPRESPPAE